MDWDHRGVWWDENRSRVLAPLAVVLFVAGLAVGVVVSREFGVVLAVAGLMMAGSS